MSTGDHRAATVDCPLCTVVVLGQGPDDTAAVVAAADALDQHLTEHHQGDQCHASGR